MPKFGKRSLRNLNEAHPKIRRVMDEVIKYHDCSVIEGHRPKSEQDAVYHAGKSKVKWPNSKHNSTPSNAIDVVPYPVDWNDKKRFYYFAGLVIGIAASMGIKLRWGGDWDQDNDFKDQSFHDLPHFELDASEITKSDNFAKDGLPKDVLPEGPSDQDIEDKLEGLE